MKVPAALARTVIYPLQEYACHRPTFPYLTELECSQWLTRDAIESLQLEKLRRLLEITHEHAPWHRVRMHEAGLRPDDFTDFADLRKLPRMTKQDAAANRDDLVWHGVPGGAFKYNIGGSSGQPLIFHFGRQRQASDLQVSIVAYMAAGAFLGLAYFDYIYHLIAVAVVVHFLTTNAQPASAAATVSGAQQPATQSRLRAFHRR